MCPNDFDFGIRKSFFFRRRMKCIFRFVYLICIVFFILSFYFLGIIQFDSNKISMNFYPSQLSSVNEPNLSLGIGNYLKKNRIENPNVTRLFFELDVNRNLIISKLTAEEVSDVIELKRKCMDHIEMIQNAQRLEFKNEVKESRNLTKFDLTPESIEYDELELDTKLEEGSYLERSDLVNILKYERNAIPVKPMTVKTVLETYISDHKNNDMILMNHYGLSISEFGLSNDMRMITSVLKSMASHKVTSCSEKARGTQIKILMDLEDGTKVIVKPQKVARNYETPPDHFYFVDFERHHAEIAAFHVDRLLNFFRCPPTVGRVFNMTSEILHNSDPELAKTFFFSPVGNTCFTGHCSYYCDSTHATCGKPGDRLEASVQLMLPNKPVIIWDSIKHPYRRSYSKRKRADWETDKRYCFEQVFQDTDLHGKVMLDLMDMSIFDFIIGNMDRHHYEKMTSLGNSTFLLHLDHGRSFGKQFHDEMSILTPVMQCCLIRFSTLERLKFLFMNNFGKLLDDSLKNDPLYPILTQNHLVAVNRRLEIILDQVSRCVQSFKATQVIIDDGY